MRYQFIDIEKQVYPVILICDAREDERLIPIVKEAARVSGRTYGARRILEELKEKGHPCGRNKARRLMKLADVSVRRKKKFKATTDSNHKLPVSPNLLARQFSASAPDRIWVSDITCLLPL